MLSDPDMGCDVLFKCIFANVLFPTFERKVIFKKKAQRMKTLTCNNPQFTNDKAVFRPSVSLLCSGFQGTGWKFRLPDACLTGSVYLYFSGSAVRGVANSYVQLLATPRTAAHQAPPSTGFSRQECWSGAPSPSPLLHI